MCLVALGISVANLHRLFWGGAAATMNVPAGFDTGFSFFYSAISYPGDVTVYDMTGNVLATLPLPVTPSDGGDPNGAFSPFFPISVPFAGTALSVDFGGAINQIAFDNVTFGSETPTGAIPEPTTFVLFAVGILSTLGIAYLRRKKGA